MLYQYFIEVVPTDIYTLLKTTKTYQYSVKDYQRPVDHHKGSHGIPGIFFKYDTSAMKIIVKQQRDSIVQFLVKLCATVGGIFVTSGLINSLVQSFWYIISCKFFKDNMKDEERKNLLHSQTSLDGQSIATADLINVAPATIDVTLNPLN